MLCRVSAHGMSDPQRPTANADPPPTAPEPVAARRRLLRGGLAAGPVLMTLVSRPVLGGGRTGGLCTAPSGFCSANASTAGRGVVCEGRTHGYWKNLQGSSWPAGCKPTTPFNTVFNTPAYAPYNGKTLLDVLNLGGGPPNNVARDIVCAYLNVQAGLTPVLTVSAVKDIWSEFTTKGYYSPSAGVQWTADDIVAYLETTMPV